MGGGTGAIAVFWGRCAARRSAGVTRDDSERPVSALVLLMRA
jgi:hypothetical protein